MKDNFDKQEHFEAEDGDEYGIGFEGNGANEYAHVVGEDKLFHGSKKNVDEDTKKIYIFTKKQIKEEMNMY